MEGVCVCDMKWVEWYSEKAFVILVYEVLINNYDLIYWFENFKIYYATSLCKIQLLTYFLIINIQQV